MALVAQYPCILVATSCKILDKPNIGFGSGMHATCGSKFRLNSNRLLYLIPTNNILKKINNNNNLITYCKLLMIVKYNTSNNFKKIIFVFYVPKDECRLMAINLKQLT